MARKIGFEKARRRARAAFSAIRPFLRFQRYACDIGANVGGWSAVLCDEFAGVLAFEPVLRNLWHWPRGLAERTGNLAICPVALADVDGTVDLAVNLLDYAQLHGQRRQLFAAQRLDTYNLQDVDFMKIDVDGCEAKVLAGAAETLARCRPVLFVEVKLMTEQQAAWLRCAHGYRFHARLDIDEIWLPVEWAPAPVRQREVVVASPDDLAGAAGAPVLTLPEASYADCLDHY